VSASMSEFFFRTDFFVVQCRKNFVGGVRVGFTASRRVGNAVVRNRCKRRLRELARQLLPLYGRESCDFVFIAKKSLFSAKWAELQDACTYALKNISSKVTK